MAISICSKQFDCRMLEKLNYLKFIAEFDFADRFVDIDSDSSPCSSEFCISNPESGKESETSKPQSEYLSESVPIRISKVTGRRMSKFIA